MIFISAVFSENLVPSPAIREAHAGIDFIDENGGGPGGRLRKRQRAKQSK
jgi:hypothetical protein